MSPRVGTDYDWIRIELWIIDEVYYPEKRTSSLVIFLMVLEMGSKGGIGDLLTRCLCTATSPMLTAECSSKSSIRSVGAADTVDIDATKMARRSVIGSE